MPFRQQDTCRKNLAIRSNFLSPLGTDYILKCRPDKDLDTMEGAVRLFAGEFSQSTLTVPGEDEKSAAWVVTPSGGLLPPGVPCRGAR